MPLPLILLLSLPLLPLLLLSLMYIIVAQIYYILFYTYMVNFTDWNMTHFLIFFSLESDSSRKLMIFLFFMKIVTKGHLHVEESSELCKFLVDHRSSIDPFVGSLFSIRNKILFFGGNLLFCFVSSYKNLAMYFIIYNEHFTLKTNIYILLYEVYCIPVSHFVRISFIVN